jgi:hypothetical protein
MKSTPKKTFFTRNHPFYSKAKKIVLLNEHSFLLKCLFHMQFIINYRSPSSHFSFIEACLGVNVFFSAINAEWRCLQSEKLSLS